MRFTTSFCFLFFFCQMLFSQSTQLMTYNIRYDNPSDGENNWHHRKAKVVDLILHYEVSIVGIQEGLHHQLEYMDSSLVNFSYIGVGRDDGKTKGEYTAIFFDSTSLTVLKEGTFWLSPTPNTISVGWDASMERICTYGLFEDKSSKERFWVFNAHFDHIGKFARLKSTNLIVEKMKEFNSENLPVVFMGDLNATPDSPPIVFAKSEMDDGLEISQKPFYGPKGTWNGFEEIIMERRIDYIFSKNLKVLSYEHLDDRRDNNLHVSDHLPVMIRISLE